MQKHDKLYSKVYLGYLRHIFEPRYGRNLSDKEVSTIADNLIAFGKVIEEFYRKKKKIHGKHFDKWVKENIVDNEVKPE
ncbi:hypothetical protein GF362_00325 [Candidatus Dojkabacteria bacterium]|nr:hypothetical protein [Candidatus Dojkabacteria bacterium]